FSGANALTLGAGQLTSIESLILLSGADSRFGGGGLAFSYDVTTNDGNVAAGASMIVNANTLRANEVLNFRGGAESNGSFRVFAGAGDDILIGGAGNDQLYGGAGADTPGGGAGDGGFAHPRAAPSPPGRPELDPQLRPRNG